MNADMQAAVASGGAALAAVLRAAPPELLPECSAAARKLIVCFFQTYYPTACLLRTPSTTPLVEHFWQKVMESPSALAATVEALQVRHEAAFQDLRVLGPYYGGPLWCRSRRSLQVSFSTTDCVC